MVGIVLLLILVVTLFMRSSSLRVDDVIVVPPALQPAKAFLDFCATNAALDALFFLGRQGGYIEIPVDIMVNPGRRLSFGRGAEMLPYWYYDNMNYIPRFEFMEQQLSDYVGEQFLDCINQADFSRQGFHVRRIRSDVRTEVNINERDVSVNIFYPMEISTLDNTIQIRIDNFFTIYDVRFKDMFNLAEYILHYENTYYFLENITIGLMSINDDIPLSGMEFKCGSDTWHISDIRSSLQDSLYHTLPEIRVEGTDYYPFYANDSVYRLYSEYADALRAAYEEPSLLDVFDADGDFLAAVEAAAGRVTPPSESLPPDAYYYFNYRVPMLDTNPKYENFSVDFNYFYDYGMDIQAKPSHNGVLKSNNIRGLQRYLSFLCINIYHFAYDINYPVVVTIHDPDALAGQGFTFRYAFPVIIRNNEGMRTKQFMDFHPTGPALDTFCLENPGRNAVIRAYEKGSTVALSDVNISMVCVNKKCPLGVTNAIGGDALLYTPLTTACSNPFIMAEKEGFMHGIHVVENEIEDIIDVEMIRLKEFNVNLRKHRLNPADGEYGPAQDVTSGTVSINIIGYIDDILYEDNFIIFPGQPNTISLPVADGDFDLSITYMAEGEDFGGGYYDVWMPRRANLIMGNTVTFHFIEALVSTLDEHAALTIAQINNITSTELLPKIN